MDFILKIWVVCQCSKTVTLVCQYATVQGEFFFATLDEV
jgi:hypothetical protein